MEDIDITFSNVQQILEEFAEEYEALLKQKLEQDGRKASSKLINSIRTGIKIGVDEYKVILQSEDYLKYVDKGRRPASKFPPREAIRDWVHDKPITPYPDRNGRLPTEEQLVFLLSRAIANNGTIKDLGYVGGDYTERTAHELYQKYEPRLQAALQKDWGETQIKILNKLQSTLKF